MAYDVKWLLRLKTGLKVGFCSNFTQNEVFLIFFFFLKTVLTGRKKSL